MVQNMTFEFISKQGVQGVISEGHIAKITHNITILYRRINRSTATDIDIDIGYNIDIG